MPGILQTLVDTVNSVSSTSVSVFSSFVTLNYYVGDIIFHGLKYLVESCGSLLITIFIAVRIALEDLVVFLQEISETFINIFGVIVHCLDLFFQFIGDVGNSIVGFFEGIFNTLADFYSLAHNTLILCVSNASFTFDLLGKSIILLANMFPRTLYVLFKGSQQLLLSSTEQIKKISSTTVDLITKASPELYLGLVVGTLSSVVLVKLTVKTIRERNVTWNTVLRLFVRLLCMVYVICVRSIARFIGMIFTIVEMTVSNLRVPMFAHAGDSDDEEEDRENLVGQVEDSDDEENERQKSKRRNYELLLERSNRKQGSRRDSSESMEDKLFREVEREREDKLCVICQDQEKCIMILPCRHLCICQSCQNPLETHRNICPICRKPVKQMIKAYL